jgi:hypothetical protein
MGITCILVLVVLYVGVWLGLYRGVTAWAAGRGAQLTSRNARLGTWALMSSVSLPIG